MDEVRNAAPKGAPHEEDAPDSPDSAQSSKGAQSGAWKAARPQDATPAGRLRRRAPGEKRDAQNLDDVETAEYPSVPDEVIDEQARRQRSDIRDLLPPDDLEEGESELPQDQTAIVPQATVRELREASRPDDTQAGASEDRTASDDSDENAEPSMVIDSAALQAEADTTGGREAAETLQLQLDSAGKVKAVRPVGAASRTPWQLTAAAGLALATLVAVVVWRTSRHDESAGRDIDAKTMEQTAPSLTVGAAAPTPPAPDGEETSRAQPAPAQDPQPGESPAEGAPEAQADEPEPASLLQPPSPDEERKWRAELERGARYMEENELRRALRSFERAASLHPQDPAAQAGIARAALARGRNERAALAFVRALELDPQNAPLFVGLGEAYRRLKRPTRSLEAYDQALALDPELTVAVRAMARVKRELSAAALDAPQVEP